MGKAIYYWTRYSDSDMDMPLSPSPFVKWVGGKRQLVAELKEYMPKEFNRYFEPFIGGGALLFSILPEVAFINDLNSDLVAVYKTFQNEDEYFKMLSLLRDHDYNHSESYYEKIRSMDRIEGYSEEPDYIKAARLIYLNKSCYNGLFRVNSKGYFNAPSSHKASINTFNLGNIETIRRYMMMRDVKVSNLDYTKAVRKAEKGDFIYFDPPYDESFTSYQNRGFSREDQNRLSKLFKSLDKKGVLLMLSNHNTEYIRELYSGYDIEIVKARRNINCKSQMRGNVEEVIIRNY